MFCLDRFCHCLIRPLPFWLFFFLFSFCPGTEKEAVNCSWETGKVRQSLGDDAKRGHGGTTTVGFGKYRYDDKTKVCLLFIVVAHQLKVKSQQAFLWQVHLQNRCVGMIHVISYNDPVGHWHKMSLECPHPFNHASVICAI